MLLHVGAGLHGLEYSSQSPTRNPTPRPYPLLRSALRPLTEIVDPSYSEPPSARRRSFSDPLPPSSLRRRPVSDILHKKDLSVRFEDPPMGLASPSPSTLQSDDDESIAGSDLSFCGGGATPSAKRRRRSQRQSSRFALAHPPPALRTKQRMLVQIRPRLLLQLQRLSDQRPIPAFDVVPSTIISGSLIIPRLAKRFPRMFRAKPELGQDDLLIIRSEDYSAPHSGDDNDSQLDNRDLIAVICPLEEYGDDCAEIVMEDGSIWTTSKRPNGSYEFSKVDMQGNIATARWVKKAIRHTSKTHTDSDASSLPPSSPAPNDFKWTFSIIDPSTRRHPILGVVTRSELEIYDTYSTMSASSGRFPPTKPFITDGQTTRPTTPIREERSTEPVTEEHKTLMMATASWLSLRQEGWPANVNPKMRRTLPHCRSPSSTERRRTFPLEVTPVTSPTASPSQYFPNNGDVPPLQRAMSPPSVVQRSLSTGAAFMRRRRLSSMPTEKGQPVESVGEDKNSEEVVVPDMRRSKTSATGEEETHTCRIKVRRLTKRLFHRKSCQAQ